MYAKWVEEDGRFSFSVNDNGGMQITDEEHASLFAVYDVPVVIVPDENGKPVVAHDPGPVLTREEVEQLRLRAYADPITGSDRYFAEALSLQAEGFGATSAEVKEARAKGTARKAEIQSTYPWPAE